MTKLMKGLQVGKNGLVNATFMSGDASSLQHAIDDSIPRSAHGHGGKGGPWPAPWHAAPIVTMVGVAVIVVVVFGCMTLLTNWFFRELQKFLDAREGKHRKLNVSEQELEEQVHGDDE